MTFEVGLAVIAGLLALWGIVICATAKDLDWFPLEQPKEPAPLTRDERLLMAIQRQAAEREQRVWTAMQQPTHLRRVK